MRFIYALFSLEFLKQALSNLFLDGIYISQNFHFLVICYHHIHLYMIYFFGSKFYVYFQRLFQIFQVTFYLATASPLSLNPRAPLYTFCVNFLTLYFFRFLPQMAYPVSNETSGSSTAQLVSLLAHPQSGLAFTEMDTVLFDSSESETGFATQPDPTILSQTTTSDLSSEDASRTHTQDSTTVQTPDAPHLPIFNIEDSIPTTHASVPTHQHPTIPTSLVIPNDQVSNSLGSNINTLFSYLDIHCHSLYADWSTPIMFPQYKDIKKIHNDITRFVPKQFKQLTNSASFQQSYFSLEEYPILNGYDGDGFRTLCRDIQRASVLSGFHLFKDGFHPVQRLKLSKVQKFCCAHSRRYVSQQKSKTLSTPYRKSSYHQNRKNGRGPDGPKMSRRTSTIRPSLIANTCKYSFLFILTTMVSTS